VSACSFGNYELHDLLMLDDGSVGVLIAVAKDSCKVLTNKASTHAALTATLVMDLHLCLRPPDREQWLILPMPFSHHMKTKVEDMVHHEALMTLWFRVERLALNPDGIGMVHKRAMSNIVAGLILCEVMGPHLSCLLAHELRLQPQSEANSLFWRVL